MYSTPPVQSRERKMKVDCVANKLGRRYEILAKTVAFKGPLPEQEFLLSADFFFTLVGAMMEVKCAGKDQFKIFPEHHAEFLSYVPFPANHAVYMLFDYRNELTRTEARTRGTPRTRLALRELGADENDTCELDVQCRYDNFIARYTQALFIVDARLVDAIRRIHPETVHLYGMDRCSDACVIRLNRTLLKRLAANLRDELCELGFRKELAKWLPPCAKSCPVRNIRMVFAGQILSFRLYLLVPNGLKEMLLRRLNGTVEKPALTPR